MEGNCEDVAYINGVYAESPDHTRTCKLRKLIRGKGRGSCDEFQCHILLSLWKLLLSLTVPDEGRS